MLELDPILGAASSPPRSHGDPSCQTVCKMLSSQSPEITPICCLCLSPVPGLLLNPQLPRATGVTIPAAAPRIGLMVVQTLTNGLITTQNRALFFFKCSESLTAPRGYNLDFVAFPSLHLYFAVIFSVPKPGQWMDSFQEC